MQFIPQLTRQMKSNATRYAKLRECFDDLAKNVKEVYDSAEGKEFHVQVERQIEHAQFTAEYCGITLVAAFSVYYSDSTVLLGKIEFFKLPKYPRKDVVKVDTVTFDGNGEIDKGQSNESLNTYAQGPYVLLQVLHNALAQDAAGV